MYDRYEFDPDIEREMREFDELIARHKEKTESDKKAYEAIQQADWEKVKTKENPPPKKSTHPYTDRQDILESCRKQTASGGSYYALGEFYKKLNQS